MTHDDKLFNGGLRREIALDLRTKEHFGRRRSRRHSRRIVRNARITAHSPELTL